jgi:hypothetical protein
MRKKDVDLLLRISDLQNRRCSDSDTDGLEEGWEVERLKKKLAKRLKRNRK